MLKNKFIPVALDVWYYERRKDESGDFFRKVVFQREGMQEGKTTQGFYIFNPAGELLRGWNNRDTEKVKRFLSETLKDYTPPESADIKNKQDKDFARTPPEDGLVVDVFSKITQADWPEAADDWKKIMQNSLGRDHLWITKSEKAALAKGEFPETLTARIARFHMIDNTRGEPDMWRKKEARVASVSMKPIEGFAGKFQVEGSVVLKTDKDDRGYEAKLYGYVEAKDGKVCRLDLVSRGSFHGDCTYTRGAPPGKFTLSIAFTIAGEGEATKVPPQGSRDIRDYLRD